MDKKCPKNQTVGQQTNIEKFKIWDYSWTVLILVEAYAPKDEFEPGGISEFFYCSGSLLKPFLVLTSASCLQRFPPHYKLFDVAIYGDYNRSELVLFEEKDEDQFDEIVEPREKNPKCRALNQPIMYRKRYIYYYNYAISYKNSDPDIALIGLKESILFNFTNKISVPVASSCYSIDYGNCLITELKENKRIRAEYVCRVTFRNKTVNDEFMQQSLKKNNGILHCYQKNVKLELSYHGGNPIVCQIESNPKKYVQVGILKVQDEHKTFTYLPDIINL